LEVAVHSKHWI